jgi:hypothetical protein
MTSKNHCSSYNRFAKKSAKVLRKIFNLFASFVVDP